MHASPIEAPARPISHVTEIPKQKNKNKKKTSTIFPSPPLGVGEGKWGGMVQGDAWRPYGNTYW